MRQPIVLCGALCLGTFIVGAIGGQDPPIAFSKTAPAGRPNEHYIGNRPPLAESPLVKLPVGSVKPRGWLRSQLELMAKGMTGRLPELSRWCKSENSAWASPEGEGEHGWEELPYWLKGFISLGHILEDDRITKEARSWVERILASQDEDGWFGPRENKEKDDIWPNMVAIHVLQTHYEATEDPRVLGFLQKYARWQLALPRERLLPGSWQKVRGGDNLASVYWLYNRTGDRKLPELATVLHERTVPWVDGIPNWHGVNICQGFREPAVFWQQSQEPAHLEAAERNYKQVLELYGQVPGGMFGADENARKGHSGPRQGAESCSMVEFMLSFEMLLGITGDPKHGDRCEDVAFNSLPASHTADLKALHYLTAPNMVQCDKENKAPAIENSGCMLAFSPGERYRCCQHNVSHGWPYFTEHLFMATRGNGLAAVLYAPCEVNAQVGDGVKVKIEEETDYPFTDRVGFKVTAQRPVKFPLTLRIPAWAVGAGVSLNGNALEAPEDLAGPSFVTVTKTWTTGDRLLLVLPMRTGIRRWKANGDSISVDRGPLTYSLKIGEKWSRFGGTDEWPELELFPTTPWNYGLAVDEKSPESSFEVVEKPELLPVKTFALEAAPIELKTRGRRIPTWTLEGGLAANPPSSPAATKEPLEDLVLVPMGFARLRITAFPAVEGGPAAEKPGG